MKKTLIAAAMLALVAPAVNALEIITKRASPMDFRSSAPHVSEQKERPWFRMRKRVEPVGKGPFAYRGPFDYTPPGVRKAFYRRTGAKIGPCVETAQVRVPGGGAPIHSCVAWTIIQGGQHHKVGDTFRYPDSVILSRNKGEKR